MNKHVASNSKHNCGISETGFVIRGSGVRAPLPAPFHKSLDKDVVTGCSGDQELPPEIPECPDPLSSLGVNGPTRRQYGAGRIFQRFNRWSVRYRGREHSTGSTDYAVAEKLLGELRVGACPAIALKKQRTRERKAARKSVEYALACGRLKREPCAVCGGDNAQAHHEDYARPLDVQWLCRSHHDELHRNQKAALKSQSVPSGTPPPLQARCNPIPAHAAPASDSAGVAASGRSEPELPDDGRREHLPECAFRIASECAAAIECEHGFDCCPTCDPCTCRRAERAA